MKQCLETELVRGRRIFDRQNARQAAGVADDNLIDQLEFGLKNFLDLVRWRQGFRGCYEFAGINQVPEATHRSANPQHLCQDRSSRLRKSMRTYARSRVVKVYQKALPLAVDPISSS